MADYDASAILTGDLGQVETELESLPTLPGKTATIDSPAFSTASASETTIENLTISGAVADEVYLITCDLAVSGTTANEFRFRLRSSTTALNSGWSYFTSSSTLTHGRAQTVSLTAYILGATLITNSGNVNVTTERLTGSGTLYSAVRNWTYVATKTRS